MSYRLFTCIGLTCMYVNMMHMIRYGYNRSKARAHQFQGHAEYLVKYEHIFSRGFSWLHTRVGNLSIFIIQVRVHVFRNVSLRLYTIGCKSVLSIISINGRRYAWIMFFWGEVGGGGWGGSSTLNQRWFHIVGR